MFIHRLSSIQGVDRVIVLDKGAVREQGSPQQLMALQGGLFAKLAQQASQGGDDSLDAGASVSEEDQAPAWGAAGQQGSVAAAAV